MDINSSYGSNNNNNDNTDYDNDNDQPSFRKNNYCASIKNKPK